jgi:hypothetical protein
MSSEQEVSLGEVYRICLAIQADVKTQNGRVNALEKDAIRIKTLWTAVVLIVGFFGDYLRSKVGMP